MFDRYTSSKRKKKHMGRRALAVGSVLIHLAIAGGLIIMGFWEINEIGRPNRGVAMATSFSPSSGGGAEKPAAKKVERKKRLVRDSRQPDPRPQEEVKTGSQSSTEGKGGDLNATGTNTGTGIGIGIAGPGGIPCLDLAGCDGSGPGVPEIRPTPEAKLLPPTVLSELRRVAGDPQIQPPTSTQNAMSQRNQRRALAVVKMCLDTEGVVNRPTIVKSSGYAEYDAKLLSKIRRWRYRPYRANGAAIAICTHLTFIYQQE